MRRTYPARPYAALLIAAGLGLALAAAPAATAATAATGAAAAAGAAEADGQWTAAAPVPGLAALDVGKLAELDDIACASGGNCAAGGSYTAAGGAVQAWIASEVNGSWQPATEVPGTAAMNRGGYASIEYVACPAAGACVAVGQAAGELGGAMTTFVATETAGGGWSVATPIGPAAGLFVAGISCPQAGACVLGGQTGDYPRVRVEEGAGWGPPRTLPGLAALSRGGGATLDALTCPKPGNCVFGGSFDSPVGHRSGTDIEQAFVAAEVNGRWGSAIEVPGIAGLDAGGLAQVLTISCPSAGGWIQYDGSAPISSYSGYVAEYTPPADLSYQPPAGGWTATRDRSR